MQEPAFFVSEPEEIRSCVVFASPHSGCAYPESFLERTILDPLAIRSSEDAFVDRLFDSAPTFGAPLLRGNVPRAYIDFNRGIEELDPALILGARRQGHNPRVASGLGVIPRVVANGRSIYAGKLTMDEAVRRIDDCWRPYHQQLQQLLNTASARFGQAILVDCHSMPHEAMDGVSAHGRLPRPEVVLGDRFGAAADGDIVDRIEGALQRAGFRVARNAPFAGAYVTQAYGRPSRGQHAIQIEIDRAIYMDEATVRPSADFDTVQARLGGVIAEIAAIGQERLPLAAE